MTKQRLFSRTFGLIAGCLFAGLPAVAAGPVVFWASDPVRPDETVLVAGAGFGKEPTVELLRLEDGTPGDPRDESLSWPKDARPCRPEVLQPANESLKFVIPADFAPGAYMFRIRTPQGEYSEPVRLNCPTVYWVQGDRGNGAASPGGWLRVFGRCVAASGCTPVVLLRSPQRKRQLRLSGTADGQWSVAVNLPPSTAEGEYEIRVHNGRGGRSGWSRAGTLRVTEEKPWPDRVFNVRDYGAAGRGEIADMVAVHRALAAAEAAGGGVVFFPRGRYAMQDTLRVPRYVTLRGEREDWVSIFWPDTDEPYILVQGADHFALENLTLYASNYTHAIAGDIEGPNAGYVRLHRVRFRGVLYRGHLKPEEIDRRFRTSLHLSSGGGDTVRLGGPGIVITDCDLYGSGRGLFLLRARGGYVARNTFYNGRWGWYCLSGSDGLIFEHNQIVGADLMSTGGGINCLYGCGFSRNVYYAHNTVRLCHGWDREAMTTDAGGAAYYGPVENADGVRLLLPKPGAFGKGRDWRGAGVFILGGTGMGQYREIRKVSEDGRAVTLDRPWDVPPDASSVVTVTMMHRNYLFIGNRFEDAGIALQYYGTSIGHVAAGNVAVRAGGFYNSGRWYHGFQPSWYCQFLDNRILEGNGYRFGPNNATLADDSFLGTLGLQRFDNRTPLAYCTVHRRNRLFNNACIRLQGIKRDAPGVRDVVVEHNTVENAAVGLYVDGGCVGVLARKNTFQKVDAPQYDASRHVREAAKRREALEKEAGPAAYYTFDEPVKRLIPDDSGHGFVGYAGRSVRFVRGLSGKALELDGKSFVTIDDRSVLRFPRFTVAAWILPTENGGRWGIVAKRTQNAPCPYVLAVRDNRPCFEAADADGRWTYNLMGPPVVRPDAWNFLAAVVVEAGSVELWCNGKRVARKQVQKPLTVVDWPLTIGYEAWGGKPPNPRGNGNFHGLIDEVSIWPRALSADELGNLYAKFAEQAKKENARRAEEARQRAERLKRLGRAVEHAEGVAWKPVAIETFDGTQLPADWLALRGRWSVRDGVLHCDEVSFFGFSHPLQPPLRIEYDARSRRPGDMSAFWGSREKTYKDGYFIGFASNANTLNKLLRLGVQVQSTDKPRALPGKWYHVIAQVLGDGRVQLFVDGQRVLDWKDPKPVRTADTAGILAWSEADFDNLVIYTGVPKNP